MFQSSVPIYPAVPIHPVLKYAVWQTWVCYNDVSCKLRKHTSPPPPRGQPPFATFDIGRRGKVEQKCCRNKRQKYKILLKLHQVILSSAKVRPKITKLGILKTLNSYEWME